MLGWIVFGGLLMSAIALIGGVTVIMDRAALERMLLPFISLAAGTLIGGAFFHMLPESIGAIGARSAAVAVVAGFAVFLGVEQFLHWHQTHRHTSEERRPVTYLILLGDAVHNLVGGLAVAGTFLINPSAGIVAWIAAVAHEIPQELGDFGVLVHGGFPRRSALFWNLMSALTFPLGGLIAWFSAQSFDTAWLVAFGAGNFVYIAASDLVPEIKEPQRLSTAAVNFGLFVLGLALTLALAWFMHEW